MTWLRAGPTWHLFSALGASACGLWEVVFAAPPPDTRGRIWSRRDSVCRRCKRLERVNG
jgi:hypothetical protein